METLSSLAHRYKQILKQADYPTSDRITEIINSSINQLKKTNPAVMKGTLTATNINVQNTIDQMFVNFLLNVSNDNKLIDQLANTKPERNTLVSNQVLSDLQNVFKNFNFKVHYSEFSTEAPSWLSF